MPPPPKKKIGQWVTSLTREIFPTVIKLEESFNPKSIVGPILVNGWTGVVGNLMLLAC